MSEDRCVICGNYVPEGRMVCPECDARTKTLIDGRFCTPLIFEPSLTKDECPMCRRPMKNLSHGEMVQIAEEKRKLTPRYIDADAVIQAMWLNLYHLEDEMEKKHGLDPIERLNVQNGFESALKAVVTFPSSEVVEQKKGKWIVTGTFDDFLKCSCCGYKKPWNEDIFNFCPNCGAEMEKTDAEIY